MLAAAGSMADRNGARSRIDEEIRHLKSARNELATISQLPTELLLAIFKHAQLAADGFSSPYESKWMKMDKWAELITVSHVCSSWRAIALNCPSLWSRIIFSNPKVTEEMLSRSKSSPLSVVILYYNIMDDNDDEPMLSSVSQTLLNMERLDCLHLSFPEYLLHRLLDTVNGARCLRLRSLLINNSRGKDGYLIPSCILSLPMPRLRHLNLTNCTIPWDSLRGISSLVSLRLVRVPVSSRRQFFDLLASNSDLQSLYLQSALTKFSTDVVSPVKLPQLSCLSVLFATLPECVHLQRHISYPVNAANVYFCPSRVVANVADAKSLISSCQELLDRPDSSSLLFANFGSPRIFVSQTPCLCNACGGYSPPDGEAAVSFDLSDFIDLHNQRPRWLELLSIPALTTLVIDERSSSCSTDEWLEFFHRHPGITKIRIMDRSTQSVLTALSQTCVEDTVAEDGVLAEGLHQSIPIPERLRPCLPNLVTLELELFLRYTAVCSEEYAGKFDLLHKCLSKRSDCGAQVQRLNFVLCENLSVVACKALKEHVGRIMLDGVDYDLDGKVE